MEFCIYRSDISLEANRCRCNNKMVKVPDGCIPLEICVDCPWASRIMNEAMLRQSGENVIAPNPNFQQPGIIEMGTNFIKSTVKHVVNGAESVSEGVYKERLSICNGCDQRDGTGCRICGCNLARKARWASNLCPIGKWKEVP